MSCPANEYLDPLFPGLGRQLNCLFGGPVGRGHGDIVGDVESFEHDQGAFHHRKIRVRAHDYTHLGRDGHAFQCLGPNILSFEAVLEINFSTGFICSINGVCNRIAQGCHPKHPAAGCYHLAVVHGRTGMEYHGVLDPIGLIQPCDLMAFFVRSRISARSNDHTHGSPWINLDCMIMQGPVAAGFHQRYQVVFQPHEDGLGFRIAKTGIEFQYPDVLLVNH